MEETIFAKLKIVRLGILFSLLTLLFGFGLGATFGMHEDQLKSHLKAEGQKVLLLHYGGSEVPMKKVTDKAWVYFKRAHLHANGLGTSSLALILLLASLPVGAMIRKWTALGLGIGGLGYGLSWLMAGLRAPGLGGTSAAKESLVWLAVPSVGLCLGGLIVVLGSVVYALFLKKEPI